MKNTNLLEKIGFAMVVIGLILLFMNSITKNEQILWLSEQNEIIHWLGLGIWATGYFIREKKNSDN